jgi:hypothetical protein
VEVKDAVQEAVVEEVTEIADMLMEERCTKPTTVTSISKCPDEKLFHSADIERAVEVAHHYYWC